MLGTFGRGDVVDDDTFAHYLAALQAPRRIRMVSLADELSSRRAASTRTVDCSPLRDVVGPTVRGSGGGHVADHVVRRF